MKLFFFQNDSLMGEPFWQNNSTASQIIGGDFAKFCGLFRIYEFY
jgi:hypothetical protein